MIRLLAPLLALVAAPALAQPLSCSLPTSAESPPLAAPDGPVRASVPITQYTLSLSWAPDFCATHSGADTGGECNGKTARFGFILHGLWPDGDNGTWPQWCPSTVRVPAEVVRSMACTTPSPALVAHEWGKHGTCMAPNPAAYFAQSSAMFRALHWPDMATLARRPHLTAGQLRDAFVAANPRYPRESIGVMTGDGTSLQEVHLCHNRAMRPTACQMRGSPDSAELRITPL